MCNLYRKPLYVSIVHPCTVPGQSDNLIGPCATELLYNYLATGPRYKLFSFPEKRVNSTDFDLGYVNTTMLI